MRTEEFDNAICKSLRGLIRPCTEAEVDAVYKYVRSKKYIRSRRGAFYRTLLLIVVANVIGIIVLIGLICWYSI